MSKLNDVEDKIKESNASLTEKIAEATSATKDKAEEVTHSLMEKASHLQDNFVEQIKANPYKALAIALISGWLLAKL